MKSSYSQICSWLFTILLILSTGISAQAQTWSPVSPVTVCPGETRDYVLSGIAANQRISLSFTTAVSGGTLLNTPTLSSGSVTYRVRWDDVATGGKLNAYFEQSTVSGNTTTWKDAPTQELVALIRSVAGETVASGSYSLPYCSTTPFTLTLPAENFPNVPNEAIPAYLWEVPAS